MPILICSSTYSGCGFVGHTDEFTSELVGDGLQGFDGDIIHCPQCDEDFCFEITAENLDSLTNDGNRELTRKLTNNDDSVVAIAQCGCVHHAEDGIACIHDVALARERYYA